MNKANTTITILHPAINIYSNSKHIGKKEIGIGKRKTHIGCRKYKNRHVYHVDLVYLSVFL